MNKFMYKTSKILKTYFLYLLPFFLNRKMTAKERIKKHERYFDIKNSELLNGDNVLFKKLLEEAKYYGEYGVGSTTIHALKKEKKIIAVDSSYAWINEVSKSVINSRTTDLKYVNLGKVEDWGYPLGYTKKENFKLYRNYIWQKAEKPDLVMIDGRFRVACFLTSLRYANPKTKIYFDDYLTRPFYHVVEEFEVPIEETTRAAVFIVNGSYDIEKLDYLINKFEYVLD